MLNWIKLISPGVILGGWRVVLALVLACGASAAPAPDEAELITLTREFERALEGAGDAAALGRLLHPDYNYTGPVRPDLKPGKTDRVARRIGLGGGAGNELEVRRAGPVAVVTGGYSADQKRVKPRFVERGRFTMTWVSEGGQWKVLAEHRSLNDELEWTLATAKSPVVAPAEPAPDPFAANSERRPGEQVEAQALRGALATRFGRLFRPYEANQIGYTFDEGDASFMDFKFSTMFPIFHHGYPDPIRRSTGESPWREFGGFTGPNVYFAATVRGGQYIDTRPSSPVVAKRFNPVLAVRFWATDRAGGQESEDNFLEFAYGHESNGQFIASRARFDEQLRVYLNQARDAATAAEAEQARKTAFLSARGNISRGWDYLGLQFARDWDADLAWAPEARVAFRAKFNYFLPTGLLQGGAEQYNAWEADPEGKARRSVDGLSFRYVLTAATPQGSAEPEGWERVLQFERRYALTWTTGYEDPFRFNTVQFEVGVKLFELPLMVWYRYGYNRDLTDYYRRDHSAGLMLSFWSF